MRAQTILVFVLFLAVRAASQEVPKLPKQAQCKFSDGTTITVAYSYERKSYLFTTDGTLLTIRGVRVPAGDYAVLPVKDSDNNWALTMRKQTLNTGDWVLPPLPMSVATQPVPAGSFPIAFDQTGGSCMMYWRQKNSKTLLSLEFTKENGDVPADVRLSD
jgi:hypothetical protein